MAKNNEKFNGSSFLKLVENDFKTLYINGTSDHQNGPDIDQGVPDHRLEHSGQNYPLEASGEPGGDDEVGSQFNVPQPNARAEQIADTGPHSNEDVLSSSPAGSQSFEQSCEVQTWESNNASNSSDVGNNENNFPHRATDLFIAVSICAAENKGKIIKLASEAMDELKKVGMEGPPLWTIDKDKDIEILNDIEYLKEFANIHTTIREIIRLVEVKNFIPLPTSNKSSDVSNEAPSHDDDQIHNEGTREICNVGVEPAKLVELLMDSKQWSLAFSKIVSRAIVLGVWASTGILEQNYEGAIQVMGAEFYGPTPQIPSREIYFARYCKRFSQKMWGVVDISLETLFQFPSAKRIQRRPSGCLIIEMPNGGSKVIWVEHVQVDDGPVHEYFKPIVTSGFAFTAKRWVSILTHQCAQMAPIPPIADGEPGMRSLLKLSERMMGSFCCEINARTTNKWKKLPIPEVLGGVSLIMAKTYRNNPGKPTATTFAFASSVQLPATPKELFDFLSNEESRPEWDILSQGHSVQELARIITGQEPGNHLSIVQVNSAPDKIEVLYLQQCYTDSAASYVVYAPLDIKAVSIVLNGGNPDFVRILPCGFVILPDVSKMRGGTAYGSLLTMALHIVDDVTTTGQRISPESVDIMCQIITDAFTKIRAAVAET